MNKKTWIIDQLVNGSVRDPDFTYYSAPYHLISVAEIIKKHGKIFDIEDSKAIAYFIIKRLIMKSTKSELLEILEDLKSDTAFTNADKSKINNLIEIIKAKLNEDKRKHS